MDRRFMYSPEQVAFIQEGYMSMNTRDLARAFNAMFGTDKTETAIRTVLQRRKIRCGRSQKDRIYTRTTRKYTREHIEFLRTNYTLHTVAVLTRMFNARFSMDKSTGQIKGLISRERIISGRRGRFRRGNTPWNAGTKGQRLTGPNKCSFRKGNIPGNTKPIGYERVDSKEGYVLVKVAEPNPWTGAETRFRSKHAVIYEQHFGPVPYGHVVIFRDGDKTNFDPSNLVAVTRGELAVLNKTGYGQVHEALKPSFLAMTRLNAAVSDRMKQETGGQ